MNELDIVGLCGSLRTGVIGGAAAKFGAGGECIDETTRKFVGDQMASFQKWIHAVKRRTAVAA